MLERLHTVAEFGCGITPFILRPQTQTRRLTDGEAYIGIDFFTNTAVKEFVKQQLAEHVRQPHSLLQADATQLPLGDRSVDEVVLCNVLTSGPGIPMRRYILKEASRVVKKNGKITIVETYTPEKHTLTQLRSLARDSGLRQTNRTHEHDASEIGKYNPSPPSPNKYIATFSPRRGRS